MTITQLQEQVPAAFAMEPSTDVTDRYQFIPTLPVVESLVESGWDIQRATQSFRKEDKEHASHAIWFRSPSLSSNKVGDIIPEIMLFNSHDRSKRFRINAGLFRLWCSNGCTTQVGESNQIKQRHLKAEVIDIEAKVLKAVTGTTQMMQDATLMQEHQTTEQERVALTEKALMLKYRDDYTCFKPDDITTILTPKRNEDKSDDLWTVHNVIQEKVFRGYGRKRGIKSVDERERINHALWQNSLALAN